METKLAETGPGRRPSISLKTSGQEEEEASPRQADPLLFVGRTAEAKPPGPGLGTGTELEPLELEPAAFCQLSMMLATWPALVGLELP